MNTLYIIMLKLKISLRKKLLNFLLLFFSPRKQFMVALSQNLDKYIVLYQKNLYTLHCKKEQVNSTPSRQLINTISFSH